LAYFVFVDLATLNHRVTGTFCNCNEGRTTSLQTTVSLQITLLTALLQIRAPISKLAEFR